MMFLKLFSIQDIESRIQNRGPEAESVNALDLYDTEKGDNTGTIA